jgi:3-oxoacyl-[acyl-carrier-protein] synthase-3
VVAYRGVKELVGINILGTGTYLPELCVDNAMMSKIVDTDDEWITARTGIKTRRMTGGETTWYMGAAAAKRAVDDAGIDPSEIGLIIDATITNDFFTPSVACLIQRELGAVNAMAFDLNAACTGFVYSIDVAKRLLQTDPKIKYALVAANETLSGIVDFTDRSTCVLFGDGAGAAVIERSERLYGAWLGADGRLSNVLYAKSNLKPHPFEIKSPVRMESMETDFAGGDGRLVQLGRDVYKFATKAFPEAVAKASENAGTAVDGIDVFIPHQANIRIIETAAEKLGVPMEKFVVNIQYAGNTSGASIPLALDKNIKNGRIKRGDVCCFVGFGAGATLGAVVLEY